MDVVCDCGCGWGEGEVSSAIGGRVMVDLVRVGGRGRGLRSFFAGSGEIGFGLGVCGGKSMVIFGGRLRVRARKL